MRAGWRQSNIQREFFCDLVATSGVFSLKKLNSFPCASLLPGHQT